MGSFRVPSSTAMGRLARLAIALVALAAPDEAHAGDDEELQAAVTRVEAAKYPEAIQRFEVLLDPKAAPCAAGPEVTPNGCRLTNPELIKPARAQYALALFAEGRTLEVYAQAEAILRADPTYQPNASLFPQKLVDIFVEVRGRLAEEIAEAARKKAESTQRARDAEESRKRAEAAYIAALEKQAAEETVLLERSRLYAFVPFGVGQIQNGDVALGLGFGIFEALAGGTSLVTFVIQQDLEGAADAAKSTDGVDEEQALAQNDGWTLANRVSFGAYLGAMLIGVVEANVSYQELDPETRVRPLPRKPGVSIAPVVAPARGGATLGATGRF